MEEWLRDATLLRDVLRRRLLRAMITAAGSLRRACRGKPLGGEDERDAVKLLLRLAPTLVGARHDPPPDQEEVRSLAHPSHTEAEADDLLERLEINVCKDREDAAQRWAESYRKYGREPGRYTTLDEAMRYGRSVWDRVQAQPKFVPHDQLKQGSMS
jgi:hypothetical protein